MNYNFKRASYRGDVLDARTFNELMNFVHSFNDAKKSGLTSDADILTALRASGMENAAALYRAVSRISGGSIPTEAEENTFMSAYADYSFETLNQSQQQVDALKNNFQNNECFVDGNGQSFSAKKLKEVGQKAEKQVTKSKWARFGLKI